MSIAFIDLAAQQRRIRPALDAAIARVLDSGAYVMGPEVRTLEAELAKFGETEVPALSCANGTDAVVLPLMAWGVGKGDAVFCPSFTFTATAEVIPWTEATPVFVDILPDTFNLDPVALERAVEAIKAEGKLVPKAVIAVDLFGQPADYPRILEVCSKHGLKLLADSAQGFGCTLHGEHPIHWADASSTSFFPAKPLGCYGDGGAVLVKDALVWEVMDSFRVHGKAVAHDQIETGDHDPKYLNTRIGMNSRLDTIQAAVLIEKLKIFAEEIALRNAVAARYEAGLKGHVLATPQVIEGGVSVWAQYVIEHDDREGLIAHLKAQGVPTAVYYPVPIHLQAPYAGFPRGAGGLPVSEAKAATVLALPMHPYMDTATQDRIIAAIASYKR
jgi:dTDP-4-amino-4,6-dideoxygalactose transaminase